MQRTGDGSKNGLVGAILAGQFRVERLLGEGGMGSVYLAEQLGVRRKVVVKLMRADIAEAQRATLEDRFQREARLVAQLNHPNLVHLHTFGRCETGELYLAMEYVDGRSLRQLLQAEGPLSELRVLGIVDQICAALHEAHVAGIIHRDLKPDNVMLTERRDSPDCVKVLDFGIAKLMRHQGTQPEKALTATGAIFGTPQYMAPEQVYARAVDARTDVYALGLIAYELLTGAPVFEADSAVEVMMKHTNAPVPPLSERRPGLQLRRGTESIIACALEKEPARRFADMPEMRAAVRAALQGSESEHKWRPPVGPPSRPVPSTSPPVAGTIPPQRSGVWNWLTKNIHPSHVLSWLAFFVMVSWGMYNSWSATRSITRPTTTPINMPPNGPQPPPPKPVDDGMAMLREKYAEYSRTCVGRANADFNERKDYLRSVPKPDGPAPGKKANLSATSDPQYCEKAITELQTKGPEIGLDRSVRRFVAARRALYDLTNPLSRYYDQGDYQDDATERGREQHRPLVAAFDALAVAYPPLRRDLEAAEGQLRAHYAEHVTPEEAAQLQGDAAASAIARLGNVDWRDMPKVNLTALRRAIQTYQRVLDAQPDQDNSQVQFLGTAKHFARRIEHSDWDSSERSLLKRYPDTWMVDGAPGKLLSHYTTLSAFFKKIPLLPEVSVLAFPPEMQK